MWKCLQLVAAAREEMDRLVPQVVAAVVEAA
jgi:hypothetical protein